MREHELTGDAEHSTDARRGRAARRIRCYGDLAPPATNTAGWLMPQKALRNYVPLSSKSQIGRSARVGQRTHVICE
jgi:hypothetical protein